MQIQVSPFVRGSIAFNQLASVQELAKFGSQIIQSKGYFVGQTISVTYAGRGQFSLLEKLITKNKSGYKKGELVTARYVKHVAGRGVTVQISDGIFGFIEMCEITDEISGNVIKYLSEKSIFAARVIDTDKHGKLQLSTRESVLDENAWKEIRPEGTSIRFQEQDADQQARGNQRNKILKYGAKIALSQGNLAIGYIVNIGKAGCFVQIGHNCVVRAGLNQLSDQTNFNFQERMPIGSIVVGRIARVHDQSNGDKKFDFSSRQSLVVFGVGVTDRSKLAVDAEVESIIMAVAEGKAFAQIKGTYIQIKVKGYDTSQNLQVGDHVVSKLKKVTKEKISSEYVQKASRTDMTEGERKAQSIYDSIQEESTRDVKALKALNQQGKSQANQSDFDPSLVAPSNFISNEEQIAQQIQDLNELEKGNITKDQDDDDVEIDSEDSDAEEMKRIINYD